MDVGKHIGEVFGMLEASWAGALVSAGMSAGIFNYIGESEDGVSMPEIAEALDYDPLKLDMWLYYAAFKGWIEISNDRYKLTERGLFFTPKAPSPDVKGLLQLSEYYFNAAAHAGSTFKRGHSMEELSQGKISREYQPRVTDNFAAALKDLFLQEHIQAGDNLLDVGCGDASFLQLFAKKLPDIHLTGVDTNLFSIEKGRKKIADEALTDHINLLVGDITEDLDEFPDRSYDWVTSINVMHFLDIGKRLPTIENMIRIAKKGVFVTQVMIETTPLSRAANPLMGLLWNDYTGFFYKNEMENLNKYLQGKYTSHKFTLEKIMHGNSNILLIEPK